MSDPSPEDPQVFGVLEEYLARLQAGQRPDREAVLREHPELASALACLDALEHIAPDSDVTPSGRGETTDFGSAVGVLPQDFGSYELLEEIGRGGMGVVYKARQKGLDRTVAIKMILASHLASPEHVRRFRVEAKAAAALQHSHIVHIHEVGQLHGQHYFAMEYVDGTSLAERVAGGPLEVETAVRLVGQVARAVGHLHRHGIVHRDLKPSNILLDAEGQPYVTDFGLAKVFAADSQRTATGVIAGTPSYMSPEQASGHGAEVGPKSDVYSLGAILYELLTGRPPFHEENPLDTLMQVLSREPTLPKELNRRVPRPLELICLKCLAKSPEDRYRSAEALADDLERFSRGEALEARPPHPAQKLLSWTRREPALAARLGVLGIFFVVENVNYALAAVDWDFHRKMLVLMAVWVVVSVLFQQSLKSQRWSIPARFVWGTFDSALLLAVLLAADKVDSPLVVCYPMLIVGAGLWFRVRFVWFMAGLSLASYTTLVVQSLLASPKPGPVTFSQLNHHIIFCVMLVVVAWGVAYLVQRVRTLGRYYGQKL